MDAGNRSTRAEHNGGDARAPVKSCADYAARAWRTDPKILADHRRICLPVIGSGIRGQNNQFCTFAILRLTAGPKTAFLSAVGHRPGRISAARSSAKAAHHESKCYSRKRADEDERPAGACAGCGPMGRAAGVAVFAGQLRMRILKA